MKKLNSIIFNKSDLLESVLLKEEIDAEGITPSQYKKDSKKDKPTDYDEVHDHAIRNLTGDISSISKEQKHSISRWTQNSEPGYKEMNNHMKGDKVGTKEVQKHCNNLTDVINSHELPNSTYAYRGIQRGTAESVRSLKPGDHWSNKGFASTSLDPNRSTHFGHGDIMAIHAPKGTKAIYSSHPKLNNHTDERELTFPHNTHMRFNGRETFEVHAHHYDGTPKREKQTITLHHFTVVPHTNVQGELDRE